MRNPVPTRQQSGAHHTKNPCFEQMEPRLLLAATTPIINEFLADNTKGLKDDYNLYSDWIEIYNPTASAINLNPTDASGYYLTDSSGNLNEWSFPEGTTLAAGAYLTVFADSKNTVGPSGKLHTNFKLDPDGEYLALVHREVDGVTLNVVQAFAPKYPPQAADVSYGLINNATDYQDLVDEEVQARYIVPTGTVANWNTRTFNDASWAWGDMPLGYDTTPEQLYGDVIATDLQSAMYGVNASMYMRTSFTIDNLAAVTALNLYTAYDDGFVAYINGTEVARSGNTPTTPLWNSTATTDRTDADALDWSSFLNVSRTSLVTGTNVLAIQALNYNASDTRLLFIPVLEAAITTTAEEYFATPSPGAVNVAGTVGAIGDTHFDHDRGFYSAAFDVDISCDTPGTTIRYTIDNSTPSATNGIIYTTPVHITTTTTLRAIAYRAGYTSSNVDTQTYLFLNDVIHQTNTPVDAAGNAFPTGHDYEMDPDVVNNPTYSSQMIAALQSIPTLSIVTDKSNLWGSGLVYHTSTAEKPTSIEWINPDGTTGFQINCGIKGQGPGGTREKASYRLVFRKEYGPATLDYDVFGYYDQNATTSFNDICLRAGSNDTFIGNGANGQYIQDEFDRRMDLAFGNPSLHGTFVNLYIDGLYWGLYNPVEWHSNDFAAAYWGGDKDTWDTVHALGNPKGGSDLLAWNQMQAMTGNTNAVYQQYMGNNPDGTRNFSYPVLLDMDNYIDYMLIQIWLENGDFLGHNDEASRNRVDGDGFKWYTWDGETLWTNDSALTNGNIVGGPAKIFNQLGGLSSNGWAGNTEFKLRFADHVYEAMFNGGPLTPTPAQSLYSSIADYIQLAVISESARWGDRSGTLYTQANWLTRRASVNSTMANRNTGPVKPFLTQLKNAGFFPTFDPPSLKIGGVAQYGGQVASGSTFTMTGTTGTIYYTTDGSDPHLYNATDFSTRSPTAVAWGGGSLSLTANTHIKARIWDAATSKWSALADAVFTMSTASPVRITEVMYNPQGSQWAGFAANFDTGSTTGFTTRSGTWAVTANRYQGTPGASEALATITVPGTIPSYAQIDFTARANTAAGSAYFVFDWQSATNYKYAGVSPTGNTWQIGHRDGTGLHTDASFTIYESSLASIAAATDYNITITLDGTKATLHSEIWSSAGNGYGGTVDYTYTGDALNDGSLGIASWGAACAFDNIQINQGDADQYEFIEVKNTGASAAGVAGLKFDNGVSFKALQTASLAPGAYGLIVANIDAFKSRYGTSLPILGQYTGNLENAGERVRLADATNRTVLDFRFNDSNSWPGRSDGSGSSLEVLSTSGDYSAAANWRSSSEYNGTPGAAGSGPRTDIVINEVLTHTDYPLVDAIEMYNSSASAVNIGGWWLSDSSGLYQKFQIPSGTTIGAGQYLYFNQGHWTSPTVLAFASNEFGYGVNGFALDAAHGDEVWLMSADGSGNLVQFVDHAQFDAASNGVTFGRWPSGGSTSDLYPMSSRTLGSANSGPLAPPIVISEVQYHPGQFFEDFTSGGATRFTTRSGSWSASGGNYGPSVAGDNMVTITTLNRALDTNYTVSATVTPNASSSGLIIFDYVSATDFKFAGLFTDAGKWRIGHRTSSAWVYDAEVAATLVAGQAYDLEVRVSGAAVELHADGSTVATYTFTGQTLNDGLVGLATHSGLSRFDNVTVEPGDADDLEFVEIYNPSASGVRLAQWYDANSNSVRDAGEVQPWHLSGGVDFDFPIAADMLGTLIPSHGTIVVLSYNPTNPANASRVARFRAYYGIDASVTLAGGWSGQLDDGGETVNLKWPDGPPLGEPLFTPYILADAAPYGAAAPWPTAPDGNGTSLTRTSPSAWGSDAASWQSQSPTPGTTFPITPPQVQITVPSGTFNCGQGMQAVTLTASTVNGTNTVTGIEWWQSIGGGAYAQITGVTGGGGPGTWAYSWNTTSATMGTRLVKAVAVDSGGGRTDSSNTVVVNIYMPGDGNHDGSVDGLDYNIWQNGYNSPGQTFLTGDYNGDGAVDGLDYNTWQNNYNHTATYASDGFGSMSDVPAAATTQSSDPAAASVDAAAATDGTYLASAAEPAAAASVDAADAANLSLLAIMTADLAPAPALVSAAAPSSIASSQDNESLLLEAGAYMAYAGNASHLPTSAAGFNQDALDTGADTEAFDLLAQPAVILPL